MDNNINGDADTSENITKAEAIGEKPKFSLKRKKSFKESISGASRFITGVRWAYMIISVAETIIAFVFWFSMLMFTGIMNTLPMFFWFLNTLPYIIPAMTLALIVLFIILCVDAVETKTEIKIRAIFILFTIIPVLMTWEAVAFKWMQVFN